MEVEQFMEVKDSQKVVHKTSRAFNSVSIYPEHCFVEKRSDNKQKLYAEAFWYRNLPGLLKAYAPQCLKYLSLGNEDALYMDYIPYLTAASLYVQMKCSSDFYITMIERLLSVLEDFVSADFIVDANVYTSPREELQKFYIEKTLSRLEDLRSDFQIAPLLQKNQIVINTKPLANIDFDLMCDVLKSSMKNEQPHVVHGDYCFSNILYEPQSKCVKLIDPRGLLSYKDTPIIWGSTLYDLAKLFHSVHGLYDFIIDESYVFMDLGADGYIIDLRENYEIKNTCNWLLNNSAFLGYQLRYILAHEVMLFVSMIPLHYDDPQRQLVFYLRAVQLYNEYLDYINS